MEVEHWLLDAGPSSGEPEGAGGSRPPSLLRFRALTGFGLADASWPDAAIQPQEQWKLHIETDTWLEHGRPRLRRALLAAAILLSGAVSAVIALPVLPAKQAGIVVTINPDAGETIGWPQFTQTVADIDIGTDDHAVLVTSNYGEAGAIDRYGPALGLPSAHSGHNGFADWDRHPTAPPRSSSSDSAQPSFATSSRAAISPPRSLAPPG